VKKTLLVTTILALALSGCAGREAHPVATVQYGDDQLSCLMIQGEIAGNMAQAQNLQSQAAAHNATNAGVAVVGALLFWPALFALDLTDYEKVEASALMQRDAHLQQLASEHKCSGFTTATVQ